MIVCTEENRVDMIKKINSLMLMFLAFQISSSSLINLDCATQTQNSDRKFSFNLLLGTETGKAIQILKKGQLKMDLLVTEKYYELGQFTDASKQDFITVLRLNRDTLEITYAKYMELVEPILCKRTN